MIGERCRDRLIVFEIAFLFIAIVAAPIPGNSQQSALKQSSWSDGHGNYEFYYRTEGRSYRYESGTVVQIPGTNKLIIAVKGRVEWVTPDGSKQAYEYVADQNGYRTRQIPQNGLMDNDRQESGIPVMDYNRPQSNKPTDHRAPVINYNRPDNDVTDYNGPRSDVSVINYNKPEDDAPVVDYNTPQSDRPVMDYDSMEDDDKKWEEYENEDYEENEERGERRLLDGPPGDQGIHGSGCSDNLGGSGCTDERGDVMQADQGDRPGARTPSRRLRLRNGFRRRYRSRRVK